MTNEKVARPKSRNQREEAIKKGFLGRSSKRKRNESAGAGPTPPRKFGFLVLSGKNGSDKAEKNVKTKQRDLFWVVRGPREKPHGLGEMIYFRFETGERKLSTKKKKKKKKLGGQHAKLDITSYWVQNWVGPEASGGKGHMRFKRRPGKF